MIIDDSGNIGIGTSTPSTGFNTNRNNLVISDASAAGLTINSTATDGSSIISMTDGTGTLAGEIHYVHDGDSMRFNTATAERMRIDSSGNVIQAATHIIKNAMGDSSGLKLSQESSDESRIFNHFSGAMTFGTANTERMRILAGGGLTFGGDTAAANALDDYEEGNATLAFATSDTQYTTSGQSDSSTYTRIGNQVTLFVSLSITSPTNGTGALRITGLPFTNTGPQVSTSDCSLGRMLNSATQRPFGLLGNNSDVITFYYNVNGAVGAAFSATNLNGQVTPFINFTITYTT